MMRGMAVPTTVPSSATKKSTRARPASASSFSRRPSVVVPSIYILFSSYAMCDAARWGSSELRLRFEASDPLAQGRQGAFPRLGAEDPAQRGRLHRDARDDTRSHAGRIAGDQAVLGSSIRKKLWVDVWS